MTELLTAAQMRSLEQAAIASGEVTGLELMERAGKGVVEAIFEEWPEVRTGEQRALVLCGPGNNGGDGFVVACLLKEAGWNVLVYLYGDVEKLPKDARSSFERWLLLGEVHLLRDPIETGAYDRLESWIGQDRQTPLYVVDALFGTGLSRPISASYYDSLAMFLVNVDDLWLDSGGPVTRGIAVDIPSGLCADSGKILLHEDPEWPVTDQDVYDDPRFFAFWPKLTVTFHRPKLGHVLGNGPRLCNKLRVVDIGLPVTQVNRVDQISSANAEPFFLRKSQAHKYSHGHALIVSGTHGRSGAARLAARGALRIGAGVVTVASPPAAMAENAARLDAIMLREVAGGDGLAGVLADKRINALCLGPGMGTAEAQAGLLAVVLARSSPLHEGVGRRLVLDADALTLLSQRPDLFAALHGSCVLTPHAGEFARLFPDIAAKLNAPATCGPAYSKVDATREAAARAGCVVLFKGPDTVIADPHGRCAINAAVYDHAAPWLATAGSGDVLAGFITGLLARGFSPFDAASTGAWLHVECARSFGPGLIAEDLPEELPKVFRALAL